jgi:hypothetical protein
MVGLSGQVPFGRTTERFFVEGEQHEAQQWQDVILPPDDEPEPKRQRGSVDKVPHQRWATFALAVFVICLFGGVGFGASALLKTGSRLDTFLSLFKASPPPTETSEQARPAAPTNPPQMHPQVAPLPSESLQPQPPIASPTPSAAPPAPDPVPVPAIVAPVPPPATNPSASPQTPQDEGYRIAKRHGHHRRHPHDNYVWSQELNALVPATSTAEADASAPSAPSNSPLREPSRFQRPDPLERNDLTPPRQHPSTIAPAMTGAPTAERQAPSPDDVDPFQK